MEGRGRREAVDGNIQTGLLRVTVQVVRCTKGSPS